MLGEQYVSKQPIDVGSLDNYFLNETNAVIQMKIKQAQERALNSDDDEFIIEMLLHVTNKISAGGINALEELGFVAVCTYVEVIIDGQVVLVDPIEVFNW